MDPQSTLAQSQLDISRLSDAEKRDLQQGLQNEMQKAKIQECTLPFPISAASPPGLSRPFFPQS